MTIHMVSIFPLLTFHLYKATRGYLLTFHSKTSPIIYYNNKIFGAGDNLI
jgi:hypothetical protein